MITDFLQQIVISGDLLNLLLDYAPFILTVGGIISGAAVYVDRKNRKYVDDHRKEMLGPLTDGNGGYIGDIQHSINDIKESQKIVKNYIEGDIRELKEEVRWQRRNNNLTLDANLGGQD